MEVTESAGVVRVNGRAEYNVATCQKCGASVTLTLEQRAEGLIDYWLPLLDSNIECCPAPDYFWTEGYPKHLG